MAAPTARQRRFLFVYCDGGWDQAFVFAPLIGNAKVDMEADATRAVANDIPFVDVEARPSVRSFFETWGHATCLLNGFEVRTIAHQKAQRLLLTGTASEGDDWGSIIAAGSREALALPYLVASGPSFNRELGEEVVLLGQNGQLGALLDGTALDAGRAIPRRSASASAAVEAHVQARATAAAAAAGPGREQRYTSKYALSLERLAALRTLQDQLSLVPDRGFTARLGPALTCFELGVTRAAMVQHSGLYDLGWDTHSGNAFQSRHFEQLFTDLLELLDQLATRPGTAGGTLLDEVTVVVLSDFGRHPRLNLNVGKDHWTFTSAMLIGAGVRGGQAIGAYDDDVIGERVDPASGEITDSGTELTTSHLGATLLALADIDPGPWLGDVEPIGAVLA